MLVNHLTAGVHGIRLPKTRFSEEKPQLGHIRTSLFTKDEFVLELAVESRADFLLTFNSRDFVGADRFGVRVISPREFLAIIGEAP
jgi:predicted nucleic acid-binding protein